MHFQSLFLKYVVRNDNVHLDLPFYTTVQLISICTLCIWILTEQLYRRANLPKDWIVDIMLAIRQFQTNKVFVENHNFGEVHSL